MDKKIRYRFLLLMLLVTVLGSFFLISSYRKGHYKRLSAIADELAAERRGAWYIDQAVQQLYAAENDFRLYILTQAPDRFERYSGELAEVALLLDSLGMPSGRETDLQELLDQKTQKTSLFIRARLLSDSLLIQLPELLKEIGTARGAPPRASAGRKVETDTLSAGSPDPAPGQGKNLFGRIMDAIRNDPERSREQTVTPERVIRERVWIDTPGGAGTDTAGGEILWSVAMTRHLEHLRKKELALLQANERLFTKLKHLLLALKQSELDYIRRRNLLLSRNVSHSVSRINVNNLWEQGLILFLTAGILYGIWRLYRIEVSLFRSKQEAERLAKLKSDFVATMSHEIRTPLHAITAYTGELSKKSISPEQREIVDTVKLSAGMLLSIVNNVLDYTKVENAGSAPVQAPFSPGQVIREVSDGLMILAQKKGLLLNTALALPEGTRLSGDAFQLKQVLINLINNAIKFTEQGHVTIEASLKKQEKEKAVLQLTVRDTGVGITEADLPGIFDEYRQVDLSKTSGIIPRGSGLGLAIVKKIVDLHKGSIRVESAYGSGSAFHVSIPYKVIALADTATKKPVQHVDLPGLKPLIVDNDLLGRKYLCAMLKEEGITCLEASDGKQAFQLFQEHPVNLILTDINMPDMNGLELARRVRKLPQKEKAKVPVIAVTATVLQQDIDHYLKSGFNRYLAKPYTRERLLEVIKDVMSRQG